MINVHDTDLVHRVLDGEATSAEVQDLALLAASEPRIQHEMDKMRAIFSLLDKMPDLEPPVGQFERIVARAVMPNSRLEQSQYQLSERSAVFEAGPVSSSKMTPIGSTGVWRRLFDQIKLLLEWTMTEKSTTFAGGTRGKIMIGSGIAAALVVALSTVLDIPKDASLTAGTIVPAQRAQVSQIAATGVKLGDQGIAQFMQSDDYRNIVSNDAFRVLLKDAKFISLMQDAKFISLMQDTKLVSMMQDAKLVSLMQDAKFVSLMQDAKLVSMMQDAKLVSMMQDAKFVSLMQDAKLISLMQDAKMVSMMQDAKFISLMQDAKFVSMMQDAKFVSMMQDAKLVSMMQDAKFVSMMQDAKLVSMMQDNALLQR